MPRKAGPARRSVLRRTGLQSYFERDLEDEPERLEPERDPPDFDPPEPDRLDPDAVDREEDDFARLEPDFASVDPARDALEREEPDFARVEPDFDRDDPDFDRVEPDFDRVEPDRELLDERDELDERERLDAEPDFARELVFREPVDRPFDELRELLDERRELERRREPELSLRRSAAGISSRATALASCGICFSRNFAIRSSSRLMPRSTWRAWSFVSLRWS